MKASLVVETISLVSGFGVLVFGLILLGFDVGQVVLKFASIRWGEVPGVWVTICFGLIYIIVCAISVMVTWDYAEERHNASTS